MTGHLVTTHPTVAACARCGQVVLTALVEGVPTRVDPHPVTVAGELAALLDGRWTYTRRHGELVYRDPGRIAAGTHATPVLVDHRCGKPIPPERRAPRQRTAWGCKDDLAPY